MTAFATESVNADRSCFGSSPQRCRRQHDPRSRRPKGPSSRSPIASPSSPPCGYRRPIPKQLPIPVTTPRHVTVSLPISPEHGRGVIMERTRSGNSIMSDTPYEQQLNDTLVFSDAHAAQMVEDRFQYVYLEQKAQRTKLHQLLDSRVNDDVFLSHILETINSVWFGGALTGRVQWEWSSQERYQTELIGTTALRRCLNGNGYETLIVLSEPILKSSEYDRRLLLYTFLHELVHCYLFIRCGFKARTDGGHTEGFHTIAKLIDDWIGWGHLSLCNKKLNLNLFRKDPQAQPMDYMFNVYRDDRGRRHDGYYHRPKLERNYREVVGVRYEDV